MGFGYALDGGTLALAVDGDELSIDGDDSGTVHDAKVS
jgi:hypothetical protein